MIEGVSYVEAVYFIFVTVSTIGFGDFVIRFEDQADHNRLVRTGTNSGKNSTREPFDEIK